MQQQRPEREESVLPAALPRRVAGAGDGVVPVEVPREERPETLVLGPARFPRVGTGREADPERGEQREQVLAELEERLRKQEAELATYVAQAQTEIQRRESEWWQKQLGNDAEISAA